MVYQICVFSASFTSHRLALVVIFTPNNIGGFPAVESFPYFLLFLTKLATFFFFFARFS